MISVLLGVLTFLAVGVLARRLNASARTPTRSKIRRHSTRLTSDRAERLDTLEGSVFDATESGMYFRARLRPQLRFVVIERLRRKGVELDTDPEAAELLGPLAYALLTAHESAPETADDEGLTDHEVRALTEMLERIR